MDSPEAVEWMKEGDNFGRFAAQFRPGARMRMQRKVYEVLISNLKISFRLEQDLREMEEVNGMPAGAIVAARWVKPVNRRDKEQRRAWMAVRFDDVNIANQAILNGVRFSDEHHKCQKTIREPVRCMRCQRYGHMVRDCTNAMDTCGSCGSDHRTSECDKLQHGVRWCVSCRTTDHCSWDRDCPEKGRKQAQINTRFPENNVPFFPTPEAW
ncbi:hypothetical protein C8Q74DRAFT_1180674, partial [Fomes fomentarius]